MTKDSKTYGASSEDIALLTFFNSAEIKAFLRTMVHAQARILAHLEDREADDILDELNEQKQALVRTLAEAKVKNLKPSSKEPPETE